MKSTILCLWTLCSLAVPCALILVEKQHSLYLEQPPQSVRPYVIQKNHGLALFSGSPGVFRLAVTKNSSDGAFAIVQSNGPLSEKINVPPHLHLQTYEHFYCAKGRIQMWEESNESGASQEARVLTQGDYVGVPHNTKHTFQSVDDDTQVTHVFVPGGLEEIYLANAISDWNSSTYAEYAIISGNSSGAPFRTSNQDFYLTNMQPHRDLVNGTAGAPGYNWHNGSNPLAETPTSYSFIAQNYGPKFLNAENGYKVITPLVTPGQSGGNFTMGQITMSVPMPNETLASTLLTDHTAFQMDEGQLVLHVDGYDPVDIIQGDVAFIPANTNFTYSSAVPFTKFVYFSGGSNGIDIQLLDKSIPWDYPVYPNYAGYVAS